MIIPPLGPLEPNDPFYGLQFPANTAQPIFSDEHDGVIQLRKQDNKLSLELDREQIEIARAVLTWASKSGLIGPEMDQAADILGEKLRVL